MNDNDVHPVPWLGEGSVPPGGSLPPRSPRPRGRVGLLAGSLALVLGMGVGGVAVSQLSLGTHPAPGVDSSQTPNQTPSQTQGGDDAGAAEGSGATAQAPAAGGEERDED